MEEITSYLIEPTVHSMSEVKAWEEVVLLPTYPIGSEEKNPIFLEKRIYQGSSGSVYPYPVVEKISDQKINKPYKAFFLENYYLKIMVLPELGGRVQMAYDKIRKRHFVYYNQVVKPALVGLTGPWISGGIEFNWPQHHRPTTFLPTESAIEHHVDGSCTVWCNEVERMFRTKGMQGFTLHPAKAYLEINVKIYNRTPFPQTFLWWANPAVVVHDDYKSVFPPDVHAVFDHGKRDVSKFPIATGVYYKQDYSSGVDISKYKNIPVPTSYMAVGSKYNFVGGYEENLQAGLLHVADHHIAPGKKQWTWGHGDFGRAWDRNLTDEDGPYIELMTGVFTDNQPDFSWLQPYEEKSWTQYFMPYAAVGYVKNANKHAVVNLEVKKGMASIILYTTSAYQEVIVVLKEKESGRILLNESIGISPEAPYEADVKIDSLQNNVLLFELRLKSGALLLAYEQDKPEIKPIPDAACAAKLPEEIISVEQLYLTGLHLEQYRHATYNPMDYYQEGIKRDPGDVRCNNALGLINLRRGKFVKAELFFRSAVATLTERNPNPYDGEPYYNLGEALRLQERYDEAYEAFFKSTWSAACKDAGYLAVAQIDAMRVQGFLPAVEVVNWVDVLEKVEQSLVRNWHNHKARQLKASVLRKMERKEAAKQWIAESLAIDCFNMGVLWESYLLEQTASNEEAFVECSRNWEHNVLEYAGDFVQAGLYDEALRMIDHLIERKGEELYPMVYYWAGDIAWRIGNGPLALKYWAQGAKQQPDYCFPNRIEEVKVLERAIELNPSDAKAAYYLGNFFYAKRVYKRAISFWELSVHTDANFPTVWRNLALAYYNKCNAKEQACEALERAFMLQTSDGRVLMELDQLYKRLNYPHAERLDLLERHLDLVAERDDLSIERITLYNQLGRYEEALTLLRKRNFHPWEGGEGKVTGQYLLCHLQIAKALFNESKFEAALMHLQAVDSYPHNLGEGKLINAEENDVDYYKGILYRKLGMTEFSESYLRKATIGSNEPQQAFFYNDSQPDKIFYQGLAWRELGELNHAKSCFNKLIAYGEKHLFDECRIDYFAVSLPDLAIWEDDLSRRNRIHCYYVMGLGYLGLQNKEKAQEYLGNVLAMDINHQGAQIHLNMVLDF